MTGNVYAALLGFSLIFLLVSVEFFCGSMQLKIESIIQTFFNATNVSFYERHGDWT